MTGFSFIVLSVLLFLFSVYLGFQIGIPIQTEEGYNLVVIQDESVGITEADWSSNWPCRTPGSRSAR